MAVALLLLHLLFEYLRIHQIWPILGILKVQTASSAALLLVVIVQMGKGGVRLTQQSWLLLGFLGLTFFTITTATNWFYAYQFAYTITLTLVSYFAITHILQNERDLKTFLSLLVGIHMYLALQGILGYSRTQFDYSKDFSYGYTNTTGVGGYFLGDENDLALAMIVVLPLAIYLYRQTRSLPARVFWGAGSVAILFTIIFTFSRGGFVGLVAMALYWVTTSRNRARAIGGLVLAATLVAAVAPSQYWGRIASMTETNTGSVFKRRSNWAAARRMFLDSPIWGVGGNNFGLLLPEYALDIPPEKRGNRWGRVAHSMYFQLLANFGLLGILLIGRVLLLNFRDLRQIMSLSRKRECSPSMAQLANYLRVSWVGFLVPAAFLSVLGYPHLYYLTALTVVVHGLGLPETTEKRIEPVGSLEAAG